MKHFDTTIATIDLPAMLHERFNLRTDADQRHAVATAGHEAAHLFATVAVGGYVGGAALWPRQSKRRNHSGRVQTCHQFADPEAFTDLAGWAWENVYADGAPNLSLVDVQNAARIVGAGWMEHLSPAEDFVETNAQTIYDAGILMLTMTPKAGGEIAPRNRDKLYTWMRQHRPYDTPSLREMWSMESRPPPPQNVPPPTRPLRVFHSPHFT